MNVAQSAREILEIMLRHLGHTVTIELGDDPEHPFLHIRSSDPAAICGKQGERLNDIQHLVNKILRQKLPGAPRVRVDVEHFRDKQSDDFLGEIKKIAAKMLESGQPVKLAPMNSYERRLVHNLFLEDPDIRSWSPDDAGRLKRITLAPRRKTGDG